MYGCVDSASGVSELDPYVGSRWIDRIGVHVGAPSITVEVRKADCLRVRVIFAVKSWDCDLGFTGNSELASYKASR